MAEKSFIERVKDEISSPWDWVALGLGGAGGLAVSVATHGADAGTAASAGALGAVTARKAAVAGAQKWLLLRRARKLLRRMDRNKATLDLQPSLSRDIELLQDGILTPQQFSELLGEHVAEYRKRT